MEDRLQKCILKGHTGKIRGVAISNDSRIIVSGSDDKSIRIWKLTKQKQVGLFPKSQRSEVHDQKNYDLRLWRNEDLVENFVMDGYHSDICSIAITHDDKYLLSGSYNHEFRMWSLENICQISVFGPLSSPMNCSVMSSDSMHIVCGCLDNTLRLWNLQEKLEESVITGHTSEVTCVALSDDKQYIVSGHRFQDRVFVAELGNCSTYVTAVDISMDSKYVFIGDDDAHIEVWNLENKQRKTTLKGHKWETYCIKSFRDNRYIVSGSQDCTLRVWNLEESKTESILQPHASKVRLVTISRDCRYVVSASDAAIRLWSMKELRSDICIQADQFKVNSLGITVSNKYVAACVDGENIRVWKVNCATRNE